MGILGEDLAGIDVAVDGAGDVGRGDSADGETGERVEAGLGNAIAGEGGAGRGEGIVDEGTVGGEVALTLKRCGYGDGGESRGGLAQGEALIATKHEELVADEGASGGAAELVALELGQVRGSEVEGAGIEDAIADELPGVAMPLGAARLGDDVDLGAGGMTVLGVLLSGLDLELRERIEDGRVAEGHEVGVEVGDAIEQEAIVVGAIAGGGEAAILIEADFVLLDGTAADGDVGGEQGEVNELAAVEREGANFFFADDGALGGGFGVEGGKDFRDFDALGDGADLEGDIETGGRGDVDGHAQVGEGAEAGGRGFHVVAAWGEQSEEEVAGVGGFEGTGGSGGAIGEVDAGAGDGGALLVGDAAAEGAGVGLGDEEVGGGEKEEQGEGAGERGHRRRNFVNISSGCEGWMNDW